MSAFSNWNGPDSGGGAPSLPSIKTLEGLLAKISSLESVISGYYNELEKHINNPTANALHEPLRDYATTKDADLKATLQGDTKDAVYASIKSAHDDLNTLISDIKSTVIPTAVSTETARAKQAEQALVQSTAAVATALATEAKRLTDLITAYEQQFTTDTLVVAHIKAWASGILDILNNVKGLLFNIGQLKVSDYIDFTKMSEVNAQVVPVTGQPKPTFPSDLKPQQIFLLGTLSWDYNDTNTDPSDGTIVDDYNPANKQQHSPRGSIQSGLAKHKPGTVYIKYVDTLSWEAIVNIAGGTDKAHRGSITVQVAMNSIESRDDPAISTRTLIQFGLYYGTDRSGRNQLYLGIYPEDDVLQVLKDIIIDVPETTTATVSSYQYYVAGINFKPLTPAEWSQGGVHQITTATAYGYDDYIVNGISANYFATYNYLDRLHKPVLTSSDTTLVLGDKDTPKQLEFFSAARPDITHTDGAKYQIAYLADLANSIYWQRDVRVITEDITALNGLQVWVKTPVGTTPTNADIVGPDNPDKVRQVPGTYLTDPTALVPEGRLFIVDDVALVKDSGLAKVPLADAIINTTLNETSADYDINLITGIDKSYIKKGLIVEDLAKKYGEVDAAPIEGSNIVKIIPGATRSTFTQPMYYTYTDTGWVELSPIAIPTTFDEVVHDVTYEWSGAHMATAREPGYDYYVEGYVTWTPAYEHNIVFSPLVPWSYTDLPLESYRTATRQDNIDHKLQTLATMQPDYAEERMVLEGLDLPEQSPTLPRSNPAYIHHKPWYGLAELDGGSFLQPAIQEMWFVDGGNFTGLQSGLPPVASLPSEQQFRNVIMRVMHGALRDEPEAWAIINTLPPEQQAIVWASYAWTFRWIMLDPDNPAPTDELHFSDGVQRHRFVPITAYQYTDASPAIPVLQGLEVTQEDDETHFTFSAHGTDFQTPGAPTPAEYLAFTMQSKQVTIAQEVWQTLNFDYDPNTKLIEISSPMLEDIGARVISLENNLRTHPYLVDITNVVPTSSIAPNPFLALNLKLYNGYNGTETTSVLQLFNAEGIQLSDGETYRTIQAERPQQTSQPPLLTSPLLKAALGILDRFLYMRNLELVDENTPEYPHSSPQPAAQLKITTQGLLDPASETEYQFPLLTTTYYTVWNTPDLPLLRFALNAGKGFEVESLVVSEILDWLKYIDHQPVDPDDPGGELQVIGNRADEAKDTATEAKGTADRALEVAEHAYTLSQIDLNPTKLTDVDVSFTTDNNGYAFIPIPAVVLGKPFGAHIVGDGVALPLNTLARIRLRATGAGVVWPIVNSLVTGSPPSLGGMPRIYFNCPPVICSDYSLTPEIEIMLIQSGQNVPVTTPAIMRFMYNS